VEIKNVIYLNCRNKFKSKDYKFKVDDWKDLNIQDSDDWEKIKNILVNEGGLLLQADPGTGKTYTAKNIASVLDKVRKIAPTNKASLNLKGSTIHKFLNMDIEGNISTRQLNKIKRSYEYIIVDEISMITKELWRRLVFLKQATGVKFLLLGDDFQ
jgi:ATP-dependent exoDNAse (exonuclease V) alpha subunit